MIEPHFEGTVRRVALYTAKLEPLQKYCGYELCLAVIQEATKGSCVIYFAKV